MQQAMAKEAAKLKRRSMDIEKHYQELMVQEHELAKRQMQMVIFILLAHIKIIIFYSHK